MYDSLTSKESNSAKVTWIQSENEPGIQWMSIGMVTWIQSKNEPGIQQMSMFPNFIYGKNEER